MNNIILVGMPSCGKSTLGRMLAKELHYDFLDTDEVIIRLNGCPLRDILDAQGVDGFIYSEKAMAHLKAMGKVVYLRLSFEEMDRRLGDLHARGVAIAPGSTLQDLYDERTPLYEKHADITVNIINGNSVRQSLQNLLGQL